MYTCRVKINFKSSKKSVIVKNLMTKIGPANVSGLTPFSRLVFLFCFIRVVLVTTPTEIIVIVKIFLDVDIVVKNKANVV